MACVYSQVWEIGVKLDTRAICHKYSKTNSSQNWVAYKGNCGWAPRIDVYHIQRLPSAISRTTSNTTKHILGISCVIGVRGSPERDILSLGAMGRGLDRFPRLFAHGVRCCCSIRISKLFLMCFSGVQCVGAPAFKQPFFLRIKQRRRPPHTEAQDFCQKSVNYVKTTLFLGCKTTPEAAAHRSTGLL